MVKKGYKQTEVGVIPEDWECVKIKDVAIISMCKRIFANQTSTIGDVPFYKIGTFGKEADAYISNKLYVEYRNKYSFPQKGDILISAAGTLGRTVVYDGEKAYFQDSNIVWLDINKTRLCNEYLNQYYKVIKWASSEGSTIARLYNGIIYATYISLPPLPEQQRIAEALSDVDGMISSLEKLVAKYKSIKTACLQQMFPQNGETVPRIRLPGFTGAWEQRKVSDMFKVTRGYVLAATLTNDTKSDEMPYPVYSSQTKDFGLMGYYRDYLYENSITWTTDGANAGTVNYRAGKFYCTNVCGVLLSDKVNASQMIAEALNNVAKGYVSYVGNPKLMNNVMSGIEIMIPVSPMEQKRISDYFATLDNLITLHQRKLEKIQKIKQGMMQQLLTGKIRLM